MRIGALPTKYEQGAIVMQTQKTLVQSRDYVNYSVSEGPYTYVRSTSVWKVVSRRKGVPSRMIIQYSVLLLNEDGANGRDTTII